MRISTLGDLNHDLARQPAGVGEPNGPGAAQVIPARSPPADRIHAFPSAMARRLHRERQAALDRIPVHDDPVGIPFHGLEECFR